MDAYTSFARVYDLFMDNVPYEEWSARIRQLLEAQGVSEGTVLELGCGTGRLTQRMAAGGYEMIGVDNSMEMLDIAVQQNEYSALYLLQDMQELELYGKVQAVYSACDSMNYILSEEGLVRVLEGVRRYLDADGVFLFDMNTPYKYRELLAENTFAENREEGSFIWENYFDEEEQINEYDLTLYIRQEQDEEVYGRYEEIHYQRCYELQRVEELLARSGFQVLGIYDGYSDRPLQEDSDRVLFCTKLA